jgi:hypothetical protein
MSSTSDTSKRAQASRINGARSRGPKTVHGKDRSRFNALKHGLRARTIVLPGEDPAAFQARRDAWTAQLQPRVEVERLLVERAVQVSWQLDRVDRAQAARLDDRARAAAPDRATAEADEVLALARRLFWDPRGPLALYPQSPSTFSRPTRVSWTREIDDPDDPARLVNRLEDRLLGCAWMLDRWADLRDLLEDGMPWQAPERFMAIRLLGKQPIEPIHDEPVRAIYLCCKAIDPAGTRDYADLFHELDADERMLFTTRDVERCISSQKPRDAESARAILLDLIDDRVERLEALLKRHQERDEAAGADRFGFDDTKEGAQMRSYQLAGNRALMRILDTFLKYRRETGRAASGEGDHRAGAHRRGRTDGGSAEGNPPTEPHEMTEVIPPVSEDAAPQIDDPTPATEPDPPLDPPPVGPAPSRESAPTAAAPPDPPLGEQNATNEPTSPPEGPRHPIRTTALALLALLVGLGLSAVFAAAVKGSETSPTTQEQIDAPKSQVLVLEELQSIDRPSLPAILSGRPASGRSTGRRRDLAADTRVDRSSRDDGTGIHAHAHQSRPPNEHDRPTTG